MPSQEIEIIPYSPDLKIEWDAFVENSKNGTFLFLRDYLDYHADRFPDNSFLIFRKGKLYSLLPATSKDSILFSHAGLTYGGLIMNSKCSAEGILSAFNALIDRIKTNGFKSLIYKPVPHIYHSIPSEEDLYALFRNHATLLARNISSTVNFKNPLKIQPTRRSEIKKALENNIIVSRSHNFKGFWRILEDNLRSKYAAAPVHSLNEILSLAESFPENIKLFIAEKEGELLAGILCYFSRQVVHTQYISANDEGKRLGAVDAIIDYLLNLYSSNFSFFDFGTSCGDGGRFLHESLIYHKQSFGARGICYDTYQISL